MLPEEQSYVIANLRESPKSKNFLALIESIEKVEGKRKFTSRIVRDDYPQDRDSDKVELGSKDILVTLGPEPKPGKVYGVDVANYYRKSVRHDFWGPIHIVAEMPPKFLKRLKPAMDKTAEALDKMGLSVLSSKFETYLRHGGGKYSGMYHWKHAPLEETYTDKLILYPNVITNTEHPQSLEMILYHEFGHSVRHNLLTRPNVYSAWIKAFNKTVDVQVISQRDFATHRASIIKLLHKEEIHTLQDYLKRVREDEEGYPVKVLTTAVRHTQHVHRMGVRELNALLAADKVDLFESVWPSTDIDTSELEPIVSDYATRNVEELFAEAFMFHCSKAKKLPKSIRALMDKSLTVAKDEARAAK